MRCPASSGPDGRADPSRTASTRGSSSVTATITAIDAKSRAITLKGPQGNEKTVVAGPEVKNFAQMKVGDQVLFDKYSGSKLRMEDEECLILKEEDILGIFAS